MIKITPIMLFSILLIVLVISVIMGNHFMNKEGFVSFQSSKKPRDTVFIPQYSTKKQVTKLADNMFFDSINGNLIELDAARYESSEDTTGVSINNIFVTPRVDAQHYTYTYPVKNGQKQDVQLSLLDNVASSFQTILYPSQCKNTTTTNTIYVPWGDTTYIALIGKSEDNPAVAAVPTSGTTGAIAAKVAVPGRWSVQELGMFGPAYTVDIITPPNANEFITGYVEDNDVANNTMVIEPFYHNVNKVLQLSKYVKLDLLTDNLIIQTKEGDAKSITIYSKNGQPKVVSSMPTTYAAITESHVKTNFISGFMLDNLGQNAVILMCISNKLVVILVRYTDATKTALTLRNVVRIENSVLVKAPATTTPAPSTPTAPATLTQIPVSADASNNPISEYFKWYWYWKNSTPIENNPDYLLKTQIIPPVCPASAPCPSCQTNTSTTATATPGQTCTNCGGQGGSGTLATDGNSVVNPGLGKVVDNTVSTVGGVATKTVDTAGNLLKDTGSGAVNLLKDTGSGTVNLLKDTSSGAVNLLKETGSGVKNLLKDTGSGLSQFLRSADRNNNANNGNVVVNNQRNTVYQDGALGTQTQYTSDPYSYQGQLVPKSGSQYMPITADFSSFAK